jgi:hypothetical protein
MKLIDRCINCKYLKIRVLCGEGMPTDNFACSNLEARKIANIYIIENPEEFGCIFWKEKTK